MLRNLRTDSAAKDEENKIFREVSLWPLNTHSIGFDFYANLIRRVSKKNALSISRKINCLPFELAAVKKSSIFSASERLHQLMDDGGAEMKKTSKQFSKFNLREKSVWIKSWMFEINGEWHKPSNVWLFSSPFFFHSTFLSAFLWLS